MVKRLVGILYDVLAQVKIFILLINFVILNCEVNIDIPIIRERPFLATRKALLDMKLG